MEISFRFQDQKKTPKGIEKAFMNGWFSHRFVKRLVKIINSFFSGYLKIFLMVVNNSEYYSFLSVLVFVIFVKTYFKSMKIIISSGELQKALQTVSGVISSSQSRPILENYLFELNENNLTITASDGETTLVTSIDVKSDDAGKFAVPAKIFKILSNIRRTTANVSC